jgi:hypothetical protein
MASQSRNSKRKGKARVSDNAVGGPSSRRPLPTPQPTQQSTLPWAPPSQQLLQSIDLQASEQLSTGHTDVGDDQEDS